MGEITSMIEDRKSGGSQTLLRGLDVKEACADGLISLALLTERLGLTRSMTYRLSVRSSSDATSQQFRDKATCSDPNCCA
jgi:hypothetical protein